jgi:large subunit ribosomal protein L18
MSSANVFERRKNRVRFGIKKNSNGRVRLVVFRSNQHIYAQLISNDGGQTLAQASTVEKEIAAKLKKSKSNIEAAKQVGEAIAKKAKAANINEVVFDRGPYLFHGRVKALAEAARAGGLNF